jgi:multidrug efflux pump subunit AcrA (membrane-fusion protein)
MLDPTLIEIPVELPVSLRDRVMLGAACELSLESKNPTCWSGRIKRIAPSANQLTRTFELYVEVRQNRDEAFPLLPGYFLRAEITGKTLENVLLVPRGAIQEDAVFVYEDGHAVPRSVKVERHLNDDSVVTGLDAGAIVITSNLDVLYDGAPVRLEGSENTADKPAAADADVPADATPGLGAAGPAGQGAG